MSCCGEVSPVDQAWDSVGKWWPCECLGRWWGLEHGFDLFAVRASDGDSMICQ